ncbi:MAG: DUF192 domain-containing protein [Gammaproteobacteria bacterium]|nr:DUF192 domain-containing protein [Gammaproteobacteria bacterium]
MDIGCLVNADTAEALVATVYRTTTPWERLRGLLGRVPLGAGEGLLLDPCSGVHTVMMRYPIDLVYLSRDLRVIKVVGKLVPWRCSMAFGAAMTLELAAGAAADRGIERGQDLAWRPLGEL